MGALASREAEEEGSSGVWLLIVTRGRDRRCWFHPNLGEHSIMPLKNRGVGIFLADLLDGGSDEVVLPVADAFTLIEDWARPCLKGESIK